MAQATAFDEVFDEIKGGSREDSRNRRNYVEDIGSKTADPESMPVWRTDSCRPIGIRAQAGLSGPRTSYLERR